MVLIVAQIMKISIVNGTGAYSVLVFRIICIEIPKLSYELVIVVAQIMNQYCQWDWSLFCVGL